MDSNVGYGGGRLAVLGGRSSRELKRAEGGVVSGGGVVFGVLSSSVGEKLGGARGVVGGESRSVEGGASCRIPFRRDPHIDIEGIEASVR
ncbi:hypothetical protein Tco_0534502 [Tanacetum coccineum]